MFSTDREKLRSGFWATSLGTLASRVLGLARDIATASLLGLGEGGVMDAFVVAFRVPNLARRIFGEGALAASFLPVFSAEHQRDPRRAWQLLSGLFVALSVVLVLGVLVGEGACAALAWLDGNDASNRHLIGLTAVMLPYLVFICLAAQASAALQALFSFRWPAVSPALLNICWLAAIWGIAPWFGDDKLTQAYVIAGAILVSGALQLAVQLPALVKLGFRFDFDWSASRLAVWQVARSMLPIALGMAVTQLNTIVDSLMAWTLSAPPGGQGTIGWLGDAISYPMQSGAAAAIYYGERFYQLPVALVGMAVATVIYPLLSRHAARGDRARIGADLTAALRLVWFAALPAGVGIMLVASPMTRLLFERGEFSADDAARASGMIACYASGVWAYAMAPLPVRGFFAAGDRTTPARLGLVAVSLNVALNLALVWPLAERGLAVATSLAAAVQVVLLASTFSRTVSPIDWHALAPAALKTLFATGAMTVAVLAVGQFVPVSARASNLESAVQLMLTIGGGASTYLATAWLLGAEELRLLLGRTQPAISP